MLDLRRVAVMGKEAFFIEILLYIWEFFQKSILMVVFSVIVPSLDSSKHTWKGTTTIPVVRLRALNISLFVKGSHQFSFLIICVCILLHTSTWGYPHQRVGIQAARVSLRCRGSTGQSRPNQSPWLPGLALHVPGSDLWKMWKTQMKYTLHERVKSVDHIWKVLCQQKGDDPHNCFQ